MEKTTIQIKTPADTIKVQSMLVALLQELNDKKTFDITIEQHREKRSSMLIIMLGCCKTE